MRAGGGVLGIAVALPLSLVLVMPSAAADGTFDLRWDSCTGPIERCPTGNDQNSLFASVIGLDVPHRAYQVQIAFGEATTNTVPDAWRFDQPGCQGGLGAALLQIDHLAPPSVVKACPSIQGALPSLQIKYVDFMPPQDWLPQTLLRLTLANSYGPNVQTTDPATRYFLARFLFDHAFSVIGATTPGVDCGGFESPIRFRTYRASYLDANGLEWNFGPYWYSEVTSRGSGTCVPIAAQQSTWGAIKSQYRR